MPALPYATTFATATATSACVAAMAGAVAPMAVTPQIEVPAASRAPSRGGSPAPFASSGIATKPAPTLAQAAGTVVQPVCANQPLSRALSFQLARHEI